jgi:hypothetical protein
MQRLEECVALLKELGVYFDGSKVKVKEHDFVLWLLAQPDCVIEGVKEYAQQKYSFPGVVLTGKGYKRQLDNPNPNDRFLFSLRYLACLCGNDKYVKAVYQEWDKHQKKIDFRIRAKSAAAILGVSKKTFENRRKDSTLDESKLKEDRVNARDVRFDGNEVLLLAIRRQVQKTR